MAQDLVTQWIQSYPCKAKTSKETERNLQKFLEPSRKPKVVYTDIPWEFGTACEDLSWNHCTSTLTVQKQMAFALRAVRRIKERTSAVLLQSGPDENVWADSIECYCNLRNIQDRLSDGKTPFERRFGEPLKGPIIPFGSMFEYHPRSTKDQSRIHQFGKKLLPGIFFGYVLLAGRKKKGDILAVDLEELEEIDASGIDAKRLNAKEVIMPKSGEKLKFSVADGTIKPFGTENIHLHMGSPKSRRKTPRFPGRIRRDSTTTTFSRLISGCQ